MLAYQLSVVTLLPFWMQDLIVPILGCLTNLCLDSGLVLLRNTPPLPEVLAYRASVRFTSLNVMTQLALVSPPLGHHLQLSVPDLITNTQCFRSNNKHSVF